MAVIIASAVLGMTAFRVQPPAMSESGDWGGKPECNRKESCHRYAAFWAYRTARAQGPIGAIVAVLIALAALIGLGSALFHVFANRWSEYSDVIPIWSFVALYVLAAIHLVAGASPARTFRIGVIAAAITTISVLATTGDMDGPAPLNGSLQYAPALAALVVFSLVTLWRRHRVRFWALTATLAFAVSLMFRTLDLQLCTSWPVGTHFAWHLLNGLMVGLLLQGLIRCSGPNTP